MSDQPLDTVALVIDLLKDTFGEDFFVYDGDPEAIPLFNLPAIIVDQTGDETTEAATEQDDVEDQIVVKLVMNKREDMTGSQVDPLNLTSKKIRDIVGKRDPATNNYAAQTIKGAIRSRLPEGNTILAPTMATEYGIVPRPGGEGFADLTAEGHVTFSITYTLDLDQ